MADNEHDDSDGVDNDGLEISDEDAEALLGDDTDNRGNTVGGRRKPAQDDSDEDDDEDDAPLGKAGQRALEALKEQRKAARLARDQARKEAADLKRELAKHQNANKSELQRLIEERDALKAERDAATSVARRRDVAEELAPDWAGPKQIRLVAKYVTGKTDEELEAAAEELYAQLAPKEPPKPRTTARPKERLRPGHADPEDDDEETDPRKLADAIRRNR